MPRSRTVEEEDCEVRRGRGEGINTVDGSRGDGGPDEVSEGLLREAVRASASDTDE
jgi:hypothetical protein